MNFDWPNLLPILNATGIPLLTIGIILLIRAYQKSVETYKETSTHLSEENTRLRKRLSEIDLDYFAQVERMKNIVSNSVEAIEELQARKITLLSKPMDVSNEKIFNDVEKINEAIKLLESLDLLQNEFDIRLNEQTIYMQREFQHLTRAISMLSEQIGDNQSRVTVLGVLTSSQTREKIKTEIGDNIRGVIPPIDMEENQELTLPSEVRKVEQQSEINDDHLKKKVAESASRAAEGLQGYLEESGTGPIDLEQE